MDGMLSTGAAARRLGVSVKTRQRWDREQRLMPLARSAGGRRLYAQSQLLRLLGRQAPDLPPRMIAYCRVSSQAQQPDLRNQRRVLEEFSVARGLANVEFIEEIGAGLNFNRRRLPELTDAMELSATA
jgi:putative resolvase